MELKQKDLSIKEPLPSMFLLYGKHTYFIQYIRDMVVDKALSVDDRDFNYAVYDMEEEPVERAVEDAETLPFMGERRVVVIENPLFLTNAQKKRGAVDHQTDRLLRYIEAPSPDTILIIAAPYEKLDKRKKLVKTLMKTADVREFSRIENRLVFALLKDVAQKFGITYTQAAHNQLTAMAGQDVRLLVREVEKLALYCGENEEITEDVVKQAASRTLDFDVFELVNRIMNRESAAAYKLLSGLLQQKEEPVRLLALITRQFRLVHQIMLYEGQGYSQKQLASKLGMHPYAVKVASRQLNAFSERSLQDALQLCAELDFKMKTGALDKTLALEIGINRLMNVK